MDEHEALEAAVEAGRKSPCAKSQRGVVLFHREEGVVGMGFNHPPAPFVCDGSEKCRAACGKICVHAEMAALRRYLWKRQEAGVHISDVEMLHVKVVNGEAHTSDAPSCWQCSREILDAGIKTMWLLLGTGLRRYTAEEFHRLTLEHHSLPVSRA
jgi:deoxycytidylate deaminase